MDIIIQHEPKTLRAIVKLVSYKASYKCRWHIFPKLAWKLGKWDDNATDFCLYAANFRPFVSAGFKVSRRRRSEVRYFGFTDVRTSFNGWNNHWIVTSQMKSKTRLGVSFHQSDRPFIRCNTNLVTPSLIL